MKHAGNGFLVVASGIWVIRYHLSGGARWSLWAADGLWLGVWATRPGLSPGHPQVSA